MTHTTFPSRYLRRSCEISCRLLVIAALLGITAGIAPIASSQELPPSTEGSPLSTVEVPQSTPQVLPKYAHGGELGMFRFEFDNDTWLSSDDAFTAGWSLQLHSGLKDQWDTRAGKFIGKLRPFSDDGEGGRVVRWSAGLSQLIGSPEDLTIKELQPDDAPYAGALGVHASFASYDNKTLNALQIYVGCMGPCSGAEDVQKFVHEDMGRGTPPEGWDNQLAQEWLGNVNYAWRYKLLAPAEEKYWSRHLANDFAVGGQVALGNVTRMVEGQVEYRVGWNLPAGFTHVPDPAPRGVVLDPVYVRPGSPPSAQKWSTYASVVFRAAAVDEVRASEGGRTVNGLYHPGYNPNEDDPEIVTGIHIARRGIALHLNYYRFIGNSGPEATTDWMNISFEKRF